MGAIHNELRRSQLSGALTRAVGASKGAVGIERFGETLTPVIDLWERPEWSYLRYEILLGCANNQAAVAAQQSYVALVNPITSGILVTLDQYAGDVNNVVGLVANSAAIITGGAAGTPGFARDSRWPARMGNNFNSGVATVVKGTAAALGVNTFFTFGANVLGLLPVVVSPGFAFVIASTAQNVVLNAQLAYRERKVLPGELD